MFLCFCIAGFGLTLVTSFEWFIEILWEGGVQSDAVLYQIIIRLIKSTYGIAMQCDLYVVTLIIFCFYYTSLIITLRAVNTH